MHATSRTFTVIAPLAVLLAWAGIGSGRLDAAGARVGAAPPTRPANSAMEDAVDRVASFISLSGFTSNSPMTPKRWELYRTACMTDVPLEQRLALAMVRMWPGVAVASPEFKKQSQTDLDAEEVMCRTFSTRPQFVDMYLKQAVQEAGDARISDPLETVLNEKMTPELAAKVVQATALFASLRPKEAVASRARIKQAVREAFARNPGLVQDLLAETVSPEVAKSRANVKQLMEQAQAKAPGRN